MHYADLWGVREAKYKGLLENDLSSTVWETFEAQPPFYLFTPQNLDLKGEYKAGWKVTNIFPVNSSAIKTHRDSFVVAFDQQTLENRGGADANTADYGRH